MIDIAAIARRTATEIGHAFRNGDADPINLTEYLLDQIDASASSHIFISTVRDRALREARTSTDRYRRSRPVSLLDGVPIAWKDLFDVAGSRTTAGSLLYANSPVTTCDLECVANVASAGMVCLGKLNMTEFAYSGLGLNPHFGTPLNPNDTTPRSPGGSSSGSGAGVASGLIPCAIGTDTGGSVRIPASLNGTYGFKTSEGRINKAGMIPLSRTLDTVGPLARSVEDCALLDMILRGAVTVDARRTDLGTVQMVVPTNVVLDSADSAVLENFERSLDLIQAAGARVTRRRLTTFDDLQDQTARFGSITAAESYHEYHSIVNSGDAKKMDHRVVQRILRGGKMSAHDLLSLQRGRAAAIAGIEKDLGDSILVMPTTAITAPEVASLEADVDLFHKINLLMLRNTMLGNLLNLCALAIPNGRDANGLPTSILFSAPGGHDDRLLGYGLELDRVLSVLFEPTWTRV